MKIRPIYQFIIIAFAAAFLLQAAAMTYSYTTDLKELPEGQKVDAGAATETQALSTEVSISQEIKDIIQSADPDNFEKNLSNYQTLLITLDVQKSFQDEIERLLQEGHNLPDLLTAYAFLHDAFGKVQDLEALSLKKQSGLAWDAIFTEYNRQHGEFIPRTFEPEYLEKLMQSSLITSDDIMLADRVSFRTQEPYDTVMMERMDGFSWKQLNEKRGILNSQSQIPRVQITHQQIETYRASSGLTEEKIVEAFVIAQRLGKPEQEIIDLFKAGKTKEQVYAICYEEKYY